MGESESNLEKRSSSVRDIRPGAEKRPCSDQATLRTAGTQMLFRPLYQEFHYSRSPILLWRSSSWGSQQAGMLDGICFPGSSLLRFAMFYGYARRGHTYLLRQYVPPPPLTFSTMFLSTRKHVASRVCRLHLRWHYIYIYIYKVVVLSMASDC